METRQDILDDKFPDEFRRFWCRFDLLYYPVPDASRSFLTCSEPGKLLTELLCWCSERTMR